MYFIYVNVYNKGTDMIESMLKKDDKLKSFLDRCIFENFKGPLGLSSLRLSPIQRIPRYVLLIKVFYLIYSLIYYIIILLLLLLF